MVSWNPHLKRIATISQILRRQDSTLFADEQGSLFTSLASIITIITQLEGSTYRESVTPNIVRTDTQVRDLEVLDAMDIQALVEDTVLDDVVALAGRHAACSQGMPGCLAVALHPFLNVC
jgi:hypothetical protein